MALSLIEEIAFAYLLRIILLPDMQGFLVVRYVRPNIWVVENIFQVPCGLVLGVRQEEFMAELEPLGQKFPEQL